MAEIHKRAAEDSVEYSLFPVIPDGKNSAERQKVIEEYVRSYLTFLSPHLIDVIWQNEGFNLHHVEEQGNCPAHVHGSTNYGDNIEDEWFIVYLLFQLTKQYPGLVAKVWDCDDEFLLIEAADALPKWVKPETAENRVYIYNGHLHIIPIPQSPADIASFPHTFSSVGDAVECIRTYPEQTRASQQVQTAIQNRLKSFPALMQESIHYSHCYIPASMAAILDEKPQLVAPAVRAFYYRDPIDLQACRTFTYFRPGTRIMHRTKLTRCLYAQLVHQQFHPDKRSGWSIPSSSNPKYKSHDLGMKLAHGFEILCSKASEISSPETDRHTIPTNDVRWQKYVKSLKDRNYFRNEVEGSILYQELLDNAWKFYSENLVKKKSGAINPGEEVLSLLKAVKYDIEEMRLLEPTLLPPDDDSWLTLTPESLEQMLKSRGGNHQAGQDDSVDASFDLSKIADSMKSFVGNVSGIEGAEFPNEEDDEADIQFDGSSFITAMQEMFEFQDDIGSESSSDMSEYGWENDSDDETKHKVPKQPKIKRPPSLDKYMDIMDKELAKTEVGKSFEKQGKPKSKEESKVSSKRSPSTCDINDEDDDFQPVDIDFNTVKNLLQSYSAQEGLAGPASNILNSMGVVIPPDQDIVDSAIEPKQDISVGKKKQDTTTVKVSAKQDYRDLETPVKNTPERVEDSHSSEQSRRRPEPPPRVSSQKRPDSDTNGKPDRPPRPEQPPRPEHPPRSDQHRRPDQPPRRDHPNKPEQQHRLDRSQRPDQQPRPDQPRRPDQPSRPDQPPRPDRPPGHDSRGRGGTPRTLQADRSHDTQNSINAGRSPITPTSERSARTPESKNVNTVQSPVTPTSASADRNFDTPTSVHSRRNSGPKKTRKVSESSKETEV